MTNGSPIHWRMFIGLTLSILFFSFATTHNRAESDAPSRHVTEIRTSSSLKQTTSAVHSSFMSPHVSPIILNRGFVFVVNTPADTVDVIDRSSQALHTRIHVGIDPVSIATRPDGMEVWVANHISDSVSVIDTNPVNPTYLQVIATIQEFYPDTQATRFDEPAGIAFANNGKAYVALSSENIIAVVDAVSYTHLTLPTILLV